MKIIIEPELMLRLQTIAAAWKDEFSGFGFCELEKDVIRIYDFVLLNVGTYVFTEIPTSKILPIMERSDAGKCKVWLHRHPMGSGIPGPENWSGTDEATIMTGPLGSVPELVKWSVSVVLTPRGWVGRIDNYVTKKTVHLNVEPQVKDAYAELFAIEREAMAARPFQGHPQAQGSAFAQEGRRETEAVAEALFDKLNEIQAVLQKIGDDLVEATQVLGETGDDLYTVFDDLVNEDEGETGYERTERLEAEIKDTEEVELDFGGIRGSH